MTTESFTSLWAQVGLLSHPSLALRLNLALPWVPEGGPASLAVQGGPEMLSEADAVHHYYFHKGIPSPSHGPPSLGICGLGGWAERMAGGGAWSSSGTELGKLGCSVSSAGFCCKIRNQFS